MGRIPKPIAPMFGRGLPTFPMPAPADYSDEVSTEDVEALKELVRENEVDENGDAWECVDGPGW